MTTDQTNKYKKDESYLQWLKSDLNSLIDALELDELQKRMLKSRWLDQVLWMEKRANHARYWYYGLRLTAIIGGILMPIAVTMSQTPSLAWISWLAIVLGALVAITVAVEEFFRYGDRWRHYRDTVEMLKIEAWQFFQLSGRYRRLNTHADAYQNFAKRVEDILLSNAKTYISQIVADRETEKETQTTASQQEI